MSHDFPTLYTSFDGHRRIASGPLATIALSVKQAVEAGAIGPVLIFDDTSGRSIDIDTRGSEQEVLARLASHPAYAGKTFDAAIGSSESSESVNQDGAQQRGRGRPKLGVVAREVTLLPRHWEWLATQPGGSSVALRKLVDEARRVYGEKDRRRNAQDRAYHFMSAMAGDMPAFEEATRMLFASDQQRFRELVATWPEDVRDHAIALAFAAEQAP